MENRKLRKRCKTVGCPNLHYNVNGYCDSCNAKWEEKHPRSLRGDNRPSPCKRGYDRRWQRFAKRYLAEHPVCAICGSSATCVDHKDIPADVMLDAYGKFDYDECHYQALCRSCNLEKGRFEDKKARKAYESDKKWLEMSDVGVFKS